MDVRCALVERLRQQRVDEVDRRLAGGEVALIGGVRLGGDGGPLRLLRQQLERRAVHACQGALDLRRDGNGEPEARAEREPKVVGGRDVGRVADGELQDAVREKADRNRLVPPCERLGELCDGVRGGRDGVEIDEVELVLLRQRARDHLLGGEAELDDDLAEALPGRLLHRERLLELIAREHARVDEQAPEGNPVQVGGSAQHDRLYRHQCGRPRDATEPAPVTATTAETGMAARSR